MFGKAKFLLLHSRSDARENRPTFDFCHEAHSTQLSQEEQDQWREII
jgi:hypothetical protein